MKRLLQIFLAIIPLIVSFSTTDPTLAIRFLVFSIVIISILLYYLIINKSIQKEVVLHPVMVLLGLILLAYIFSGFYNGFGSESIYVILKLFLSYVFALIFIHFVKDEGYTPLLNSFIYFSLILSAIYIYQIVANYSDIMTIESEWKRNFKFDAFGSTMGHKNLLSSMHFLLLPVLIYLLITAKKIIKILSGLALVLILITFLQTQTRAVLFALVIFSLSFLILNKTEIRKKHILGLLLSVFLFVVSGYAFIKYTNRYDAFIGEISKTLDFTSSGRYKLYKSSLELIGQHPIFGVGPGNWSVDVWEYGLYAGTIGESFAQRPHNDFLWVFSEGGFIAGISYVLLFIILLRDSYLLFRQTKGRDRLLYSLLFSCFLGYGFISLVDFPMERFSHNIIFFLLASFVIAGRIKEFKTKMATGFKLLLIIISCFALYVAIIRYSGEVHATNAIHFKGKGKWGYVIKAVDKSYNSDYYEMENTSTPLLWYRGVAYFNQKRYALALRDFQDAYEVNPYHVHVLNNLATSYEMKGDRKKAKKFYRAVFDVNPSFKESRINLAAILFNERQYVEALDMILKSKVDPHWKRKRDNFQDNYDLYLSTIVKAWIKSELSLANKKEKKVLESWMLGFEKQPYYAVKQAESVFKIRTEKNIDYLSALMIFDRKD